MDPFLLQDFGVSAMTKGRGSGGGGSIGSINDNWDAPGMVKAQMAFEIIFGIVSLIQLLYILKRLGPIPSMSVRAPYILLAIVTTFIATGYIIWAIYTRISEDLTLATAHQIDLSLKFILYFGYAFQSAAVLWLIHQRGGVLQAMKDNTTPLASRPWKRVLDWILPSVLFVLYLVVMGMAGTYYAAMDNSTLTTRQRTEYSQNRLNISYGITAMLVLVYIDVIVSAITMFVQGKTAKWADPVTRRLCFMVVPLFTIHAMEILGGQIYSVMTRTTRTTADNYSLIIAQIIIEGFCHTGVTAVLILTMSLPGVQWTAQQTGALGLYPGTPAQQWSTPNSGSTQPLYNPSQQMYFQQQYPQQPYSIPTHPSYR